MLIRSRIDGDKKAEVIRDQSIKLTHLLQQEKEAQLEQVLLRFIQRVPRYRTPLTLSI